MQMLQLASVREVEIFYVKGDTIRDTVDIRTDAGYDPILVALRYLHWCRYALLWHEDEKVVKEDFDKILRLQTGETLRTPRSSA
jgi:hypothetical protein